MPVTSSDSAPAAPFAATTAYPVYATKEACLADLEKALNGNVAKVSEVLQRIGRTDTSTWTDKGSHVN